MEPKALANLNGMIISSPVKSGGSTREAHTAPSTPMNRRDSTVWMRTPPEQLGYSMDDGAYDENVDGDLEWAEMAMLTPVPKTPAPEAIARYADELTVAIETPLPAGDDEGREELLMQTCPPRTGVYAQLGEGILAEHKDQGVMARLVAARRKSLQYAPKVSSPLTRRWDPERPGGMQ